MGGASVHAEQKMSIAEIREEVAGGWHATYEAHGRTIVVDADIIVPDISEVPAVRVRFPEELRPHDDLADDVIIGPDSIGYIKEEQPGFFASEGDYFEITGNDARAENSPITGEEAKTIADNLLASYEDQTGPLDFQIRSYIATSKYYIRDDHDGGPSTLNLDEPTSDMGRYVFMFEQLFHGIPYAAEGSFGKTVPAKLSSDFPGLLSKVEVASPDTYFMVLRPIIEEDVLTNDIPLVSFEDVKPEFEALIKAGLLREVYDVRLTYEPYIDTTAVGERFILLPVWRLRGSYVENASFDPPPPYDFTPEFQRKYLGQCVVVEAFSGKPLGSYPGWEGKDPAQFQ